MKQQTKDSQKDTSFWFWIILAFLLGAGLRLYMISDQILLDDEWHGMNIVSGKSWTYLFTHFNRRANSIPMNVYRLFLLHTFGWSEILMRIPPLAAGLVSLIILPALVKKILSPRVAIIFAFLFAISPFLVLYSRICRAYSIITLLATIAFTMLHLWAGTGKRKYAILYLTTGATAIFFHLTSVIIIFAPLGFLLLLNLFRRKSGTYNAKLKVVPEISSIIILGISISILSLILILPAFLQNPWWLNVTRETPRITLETLVGFTSLASGTSNQEVCILFWCIFVVGQILLLRKKPLLGIASLLVCLLYFAGLMVARWETINVPIEFTRFCISLFPIIFMSVAFGLDWAVRSIAVREGLKDKHAISIIVLIPAIFIGILFAASPLFSIYKSPNNFTNHSAFNESYKPLTWDKSYKSRIVPVTGIRMNKENIPGFYDDLAHRKGVRTIIEYPMYIGNHFNLYYYYQHFHRKRIIAGYVPTLDLGVWPYGDYVYGRMYADHILSRVEKPGAYRFKNMVDMLNIDALTSSPASYIILHKNLYAEMFPHLVKNKNLQRPYKPVLYLNQLYRKSFSRPVFEDSSIIVFKLLYH